MRYMFNNASSFNQNIKNWCVSNITSKPYSFDYSAGFSGDTTLQPNWGQCPVDSDGDGVYDGDDTFPYDATESADADSDGIGDNADTDDDNDGVADTEDDFPLDPTESVDTDSDGIGNNADTDDDGDGLSDDDELRYGLDPLDDLDALGDNDEDSISNIDEINAGTYRVNCEDIGLRNPQGDEWAVDIYECDSREMIGFFDPMMESVDCDSGDRLVQGLDECNLIAIPRVATPYLNTCPKDKKQGAECLEDQ
jgi:hypothetical protein